MNTAIGGLYRTTSKTKRTDIKYVMAFVMTDCMQL